MKTALLILTAFPALLVPVDSSSDAVAEARDFNCIPQGFQPEYGITGQCEQVVPLVPTRNDTAQTSQNQTFSTICPRPPLSLHDLTDCLLYRAPMSYFQQARNTHYHGHELDWLSNGCTGVGNWPLRINMLPSCQRHDFGYHNYGKQGRCDHDGRKKVDKNFYKDMMDICKQYKTWWKFYNCRSVARARYAGVRLLGSSHCKA